MMARQGTDRGTVLVVGVAEYEDPRKNRLAVARGARSFVELFSGSSHVALHTPLVGTATRTKIGEALDRWGTDGMARTGLLLWTGHCELSAADDQPRLLTSGDLGESFDIAALAAALVERPFERWVVVIDSCFAFRVGTTLADRLNRVVGRTPEARFAMLTSVDALDEAEAGVFTSALVAVLREGPSQKWWSVRDRFIDFDRLLQKLEDHLAEHAPGVGAPMQNTGGRRPGQCFPNPLYVETSIAEGLDEAHFLPKARGIEASETGWFFTGRTTALRRISTWLRTARQGIFVVTGSAGTGKSAVLGRVITLSVPAYRKQAHAAGVLDGAEEGTVPDEGDVQVAFHARERRVEELLAFLAEQLDVIDAREAADLYEPLAHQAAGLSHGFTIVVDGLDEAFGGHARRMVDEVLIPLGTRPGVKILVGTRPGVKDWSPAGQLSESVVDLDQEPETEADIRDYAYRRLTAPSSSYAGFPEVANRIAAAVTDASMTTSPLAEPRVGSFLVARVITKMLTTSPPLDITQAGWEQTLPKGLEEAFHEDLAAYGRRHTPAIEVTIRDLLRTLAWDEGQGVPRRLIPAMALAVTGRNYTYDDVTTLLREAAGHISEAEAAGWALYRLYHERFREVLRADTPELASEVHARIADQLLAAGRELGWADADPYLQRVLPRHAAFGRRLDVLLAEDGYLEIADPDALLPLLPLGGGGSTGSSARTYRRAVHGLRGLRPVERALALDIAALAGSEGDRRPHDEFRVRWRRGPQVSHLQELVGHRHTVSAVAFGEVDGQPVVVSGGRDETVRLWDARTGQPRGEPLRGHQGEVRALSFGEVDGQPVVASGGQDRIVRLWDARTGQLLGEPLRGHETSVDAVAFGHVDGQPVVASGGQDTVRFWDARTGQLLGEPLRGHQGEVRALSFGEVDGQPVVASGGQDRIVRLWDARTGQLLGEPLRGHETSVDAVAFGHVDGQPVVASGGQDTVRFWDARTGQPRGEPPRGRELYVKALAFGEVDGHPVVASGGQDRIVRLWDARTGQLLGEPLRGHETWVDAVALGHVDGQPVVVSGSRDKTVRIWDPRTGLPPGQPLPGHGATVTSVAFGEVDGHPVVVSGSADTTVRLWDAGTGMPRGELLGSHDPLAPVTSVAFGEIDGQPVVVSGGQNKVRLWDARTGLPRGEPLPGRHRSEVMAVALGEVDGQLVIASGGRDDTVRLWDARTGLPRGVLLRHGGWVMTLSFGDVDRQPVVASGGQDTVRLWDARTGLRRGEPLRGHQGWVRAVALGEIDAQPVVVSGGQDGTVRLWDARTGLRRGEPLRGHEGEIRAVALGQVDDQPVVISGGEDRTVRLWDARTGNPTAVLPVLSPVGSVATVRGGLVAGVGSSVLVVDVRGLELSPRASSRS
jgi:WD40 repeat protein